MRNGRATRTEPATARPAYVLLRISDNDYKTEDRHGVLLRVWHENRIQSLLSTEDADVLFIGGCKSNGGKFYAQFDHVILLSAPTPLLVERLATRTTNPYGKHSDELAQILGYVHTVEPLMRRTATLEVDTSVPVEQVVETILHLVVDDASAGELSDSHTLLGSPETMV